MANKVKLRSIGSLLTGKDHFFIPSYQRGYRWRRKQAEDLLSDLYSYTQRPSGDFYCLQPVIVRPIPPDDPRRRTALGDLADDPQHNLWELVDGQQRLTSIHIMLKALAVVTQSDVNSRFEIEPFTLRYESRPGFLDDIEGAGIGNTPLPKASNIDAAHANSVFHIMQEWFGEKGKGKALSKLYKGGSGDKRISIADDILKLITADTARNVVNVIWYELDPAGETDTTKEFININNGKIPLLDSELVKALFLQRRDNSPENGRETVMQRALMWELIENKLQTNDFWGFISPDDNMSEDRMMTLLTMVCQSENSTDMTLEKGDIFRYFYNAFEGKEGRQLQDALDSKWEDVIDAFHALEDWYESPVLYNYIGYLTGAKENQISISTIYRGYRKALGRQNSSADSPTAQSDKTVDDALDFREWLEKQMKLTLGNVEVIKETRENNVETGRINLPYNSKNLGTIRNLFRLLNIHMLTSQYESITSESESFINDAGVFRFPFHLYKEQQWDIEHIDSQTSNPLTAIGDKINWVIGALLDVTPALTPGEQKTLKDKLQQTDKNDSTPVDWTVFEGKVNNELYNEISNGNWDNAIQLIEKSVDTDNQNPHCIGNLTLLDSRTNRGYKNALFCTKRKYIIDALSKGRYILPATQCVFMKFFDNDALNVTSRVKWQGPDKERHHDFIYNNLKVFLPDAK